MKGDLTLENSAFVCIHVLDGTRKYEKNKQSEKNHTYICTPCWNNIEKKGWEKMIDVLRPVHRSHFEK